MSKLLALNIGSGTRKVEIEGYDVQTVDLDPSVNPTFVANWAKIPVPSNTYDLVFLSHILQGIKQTDIGVVIREWRRILRDDGKMQIIVPDLELACIEVLSCTTNPRTWQDMYGKHDVGEFHYGGYTHQALSAMIEKFGFKVNKLDVKDREINLTATKLPGWIQ